MGLPCRVRWPVAILQSQLGRIPQEMAIAKMQEKYEVVKALLHGFNYQKFFAAPANERMTIMLEAMDHILKQENGKERYLKEVNALLWAFALSVPDDQALKIRDDVGFFQAVKAAIIKNTETKSSQEQDVDTAIKQIISKAIISDRVIDVFAAAGLKKPDVSILSEEFLEKVKGNASKEPRL